MVEEEASAKQNASILLFVITAETRGLASLVEVAGLVTQGRSLILVIEDVKIGTIIEGELVNWLFFIEKKVSLKYDKKKKKKT